MPRDAIYIPSFDKGILTTPDSSEVSPSSAQWSRDVDPNGADGVLVGRKKDVHYQVADLAGVSAAAFITRDGGQHDLIAVNNVGESDPNEYTGGIGDLMPAPPPPGEYDPDLSLSDIQFFPTDNCSLVALKDFYGSKEFVRLVNFGSGNREAAFTTHNQEARFGFGPYKDRLPYWVGYVSHRRFRKETTDDLIAIPDAIGGTSVLPFLDVAINCNIGATAYTLGASRDGNTLYRVLQNGTEVLESEPGRFNRIRAMARHTLTGDIWILDVGASAVGTLYKIDPATLEPAIIAAIDQFPQLDAEAYPESMVFTDNYLWIGAGNNDAITTEGFVYRIPMADLATSGVITPTNVSPGISKLNGEGAAAFDWGQSYQDEGGSWSDRSYKVRIFRTFRRGIVALSSPSDFVGFACLVRGNDFGENNNPYVYPRYRRSSNATGDNYAQVNEGFMVIGPSSGRGTRCGWVTLPHGLYDEHLWTGFATAGTAWVGYTAGTMFRKISAGAVSPFALGYRLVTNWEEQDLGYEHAAYDAFGTHTFYVTRTEDNPQITSILTVNPQPWALTTLFESKYSINFSAAAADVFDNKDWFYRIALQYDGYQDGPMGVAYLKNTTPTSGASLTITLPQADLDSKRLSGITVWRASGNDGIPLEFYRLISTLPLDDPRWVLTGSTASITIVDNNEYEGPSYEAQTGIPETLPFRQIHYGLSTVYGNQLFMANCYHQDLPDASHFIFRSKAGRHSMVDWSTDYLRLPFVPRALVAYEGRLYAFDLNKIVRINPEQMFVEDEIVGVGVESPRSVVVTPYGVFFANKTDRYLFDGKGIYRIGWGTFTKSPDAPVEAIAWNELTHTVHPPYAGYDVAGGNILFCFARDGQDWFYVWNIERKRWDCWSFDRGTAPLQERVGFIHGMYGELYFVHNKGYSQLGADTSRFGFFWVSQDLAAGTPALKKKFYKVKVATQGSVSVAYYVDYGGSSTLMIGENIDSVDRIMKSIRLVLNGDDEIRSILVIYRRLEGLR